MAENTNNIPDNSEPNVVWIKSDQRPYKGCGYNSDPSTDPEILEKERKRKETINGRH